MALRAPNRVLPTISVYLGGLVIGLTLVSFPSSSAVLKQMHGFSDEQYGAIYLPQLVAAIFGAVGGGLLTHRLGLKRLYIVSLFAFAAAQATGDREGLASAGRDLRYWTARRSTAVVAPAPEDNSVVRFGHTVTVARDDGREQTFRIVGEDQADPAHGTVSHVSPLARALFGKGIGDVVSVAGRDAELLSIR